MMEEEDPLAENCEQNLEIFVNENSLKKDGIKNDFNIVKMERIIKLQKILKKNIKLREFKGQTQEKSKYKFIDLDSPVKKRILPLIKKTLSFSQKKTKEQIKKNNLSSEQNIHESSLLKKNQQTVLFNNQHIRTLLKQQPHTKILEQNPQQYEKQGQRSFLKLRVKNLCLQEPKHQESCLKTSKLNSSISNKSMERISLIETLNLKVSTQKEDKKDFRRKKRNASSLKLTKIQHLPQIIFPKNKKCTKSKFPSLSMAQIDNNLLTNEILEMEEMRLIEARNREKKERIFQQKIKTYQRNKFLQSIYQ